MKKTIIILHHSAAKGFEPQFDSINANHKRKKFPISLLGYFVGYQYAIEKSGQVKQARAEDERGAHTVAIDKKLDLNRDGIGICLAGDFTTEKPTQFQIEALVELVEGIISRHPIQEIKNHRDFKSTACPGVDLAGIVLEAMASRRASAAIFVPKDTDSVIKRLQRGIARAEGTTRAMLARQLERILARLQK